MTRTTRTARMKRILGVAAVAGASTVALVAAAPGASAATNTTTAAQATYNGVCGTGFKVVNSAPVSDKGTAYLTYNSSTGENCLVEIRNVAGAPVPMELYLDHDGDEIHNNFDVGNYRSYAGPLYEYGRGMCTDWWGRIEDASFYTYGTNCG
jgi:hypothetical protein